MEDLNPKRSQRQDSGWLFDGPPEDIALKVAPLSACNGGYLLVMRLSTGQVRLAATSNPAKYLRAWRNGAMRNGHPAITQVLVSKPHVRHEALKRRLGEILAEYAVDTAHIYRVDIATVKDMAFPVLHAAGLV